MKDFYFQINKISIGAISQKNRELDSRRKFYRKREAHRKTPMGFAYLAVISLSLRFLSTTMRNSTWYRLPSYRYGCGHSTSSLRSAW